MKTARMETIRINNRALRVRHWGPEDAPALFMFHGWMDSSATFQFVVDALRQPWHVIAPDWRGHGGSERTGESYLFLQHVADLDSILEHYSPGEPARVVGHSLGANTSTIYSGTRPERVKCLVNMEGLAPVPGLVIGTAAEQIARWLSNLRRGPKNPSYPDRKALAERLLMANPRLSADRAAFLAREFGRERPDGTFEFDFDPYQRAAPPMAGHEGLIESAWPRITAPVLLITATDSEIYKPFATEPGTFERRIAMLHNLEHVHLPDGGHNLHHDHAERVAGLIETFMAGKRCNET